MLLAKEGEKKVFYLLPADTMQAVAYDVWDIGYQIGEWKGNKIVQRKVIIGFETSEVIPDGKYAGKRACINKKYTLSLSEKANLRKDVESWRGIKFTEEELKGFDIEKLIGQNAMLGIVHSKVGDKTYANIGSIGKLMKGMIPMIPENQRSVPEFVQKLRDQAATVEQIDAIRKENEKKREEAAAEADTEEQTPF